MVRSLVGVEVDRTTCVVRVSGLILSLDLRRQASVKEVRVEGQTKVRGEGSTSETL